MIRYKCPNCERKLESPNIDIGKTDTCPACKHVFTVPQKSSPWRFIIIIVLLLIMGGGIATGLIASQRENKPADPKIAIQEPALKVAKKELSKKPPVEVPATKPAENPSEKIFIPFATQEHFRPLLKDYGVTIKSENLYESGKYKSVVVQLHPKIAHGSTIFHFNPEGNVEKISHLFYVREKMPDWETKQTLDYCEDLLDRVPGWKVYGTSLTETFLEKLIKVGKDHTDTISVEKTVNGIKAVLNFTPGLFSCLDITCVDGDLKRMEPSPYKPQFFGKDSKVGLWHVAWDKLEGPSNPFEPITTFAWRVTVANTSDVIRCYLVKCSLLDKQGFEIEQGYADNVYIKPGEAMPVTSRIAVTGEKAKKVANAVVTVSVGP